MDPLTRGDTRVLDLTNLRTSLGTNAFFASGDVLRFTLKLDRADADSDAILALSSADGDIAYTPGTRTAMVTIDPEDWLTQAATSITRATNCWGDVELTRADGSVITLWAGEILVNCDITRTPL